MKRPILLITTLVFIFSLALIGQQQTADGGYIIIGSSSGYSNGSTDFLVYKLDAAGTKEWRKNFGGDYYDNGLFIQQTADGGYICCGDTQSYTHGSPFYCDILVYKLDAAGNKQWRKNYGGDECDHAYTIRQTPDGGYILSGETYSYVHGTYHEDVDFVVYKLNAAGAKEWRKNYGGTDDDKGRDIIRTSDGGYAIIGDTDSYTNGFDDFLVYRLDASGTKLWRKNYGGTGEDYGYSIQQTGDGGFILGGFTETYTHGDNDFLLYKVNAAGTKQWRKNFGGSSWDYGGWVEQTSDGGYIVCGVTHSYTNGQNDFLVYKLNAAGQKDWRKNYGGEEDDNCYYLIQTTDGGYIFYGDTYSYTHGSGGSGDLLAYKVDASGTKLWRKNYGSDDDEFTGRGPK